ncbi:amidase [Actinacidiphila glaucinigra]|uniref:amidase family protein n=1 Tax=Actinacidiphila glaucinigra TaxID=235986 RepID=UPI003867438F
MPKRPRRNCSRRSPRSWPPTAPTPRRGTTGRHGEDASAGVRVPRHAPSLQEAAVVEVPVSVRRGAGGHGRPSAGRSRRSPSGLRAWLLATSTTVPFNLTGLPALSMRFGTSSDGMPIGVQVAAGWHAESTILHMASLLETLSPVRDLHPALR